MLRPAVPHDAGAIAEVYLASRRTYLPFAPLAHSDNEVRTWVREELMITRRVWVDEIDGVVVAFAAWTQREDAGWIDQLYVVPGRTGHGSGSLLLEKALSQLKRPVRLNTFQANEGARRFYERHGFRIVRLGDGLDNEERTPDVQYEIL